MAALVLVDVQHDFLAGSLAVPDGPGVVAPIVDLLKPDWRWRAVVCSQDFHPPGHISFASAHPGEWPFTRAKVSGKGGVEVEHALWPDHCVQGTAGAELDGRMLEAAEPWRAQGRLHVVQKGIDPLVEAFSSFDASCAPRLDETLRGLGATRLVVAGVATDYCVQATVLSALSLGFDDVTVVTDAVRGVEPAKGEAALAAMRDAGAKLAGLGELAATW